MLFDLHRHTLVTWELPNPVTAMSGEGRTSLLGKMMRTQILNRFALASRTEWVSSVITLIVRNSNAARINVPRSAVLHKDAQARNIELAQILIQGIKIMSSMPVVGYPRLDSSWLPRTTANSR